MRPVLPPVGRITVCVHERIYRISARIPWRIGKLSICSTARPSSMNFQKPPISCAFVIGKDSPLKLDRIAKSISCHEVGVSSYLVVPRLLVVDGVFITTTGMADTGRALIQLVQAWHDKIVTGRRWPSRLHTILLEGRIQWRQM